MAAQFPAATGGHGDGGHPTVYVGDNGTESGLFFIDVGRHKDRRLLIVAPLLIRRPHGRDGGQCRQGNGPPHAQQRATGALRQHDHLVEHPCRIQAAVAKADTVRIANPHISNADRRFGDLPGDLTLEHGAELASNPISLQTQSVGSNWLDPHHQVGVTRHDIAVHLTDAAAFAFLFQGLSNLIGQGSKGCMVRPKNLDLDGLVGPGEVIELILHGLDGFNLQLMLGILVLDLVFDLFHDLGDRPAAVFGANVRLAFRVELLVLGL